MVNIEREERLNIAIQKWSRNFTSEHHLQKQIKLEGEADVVLIFNARWQLTPEQTRERSIRSRRL